LQKEPSLFRQFRQSERPAKVAPELRRSSIDPSFTHPLRLGVMMVETPDGPYRLLRISSACDRPAIVVAANGSVGISQAKCSRDPFMIADVK